MSHAALLVVKNSLDTLTERLNNIVVQFYQAEDIDTDALWESVTEAVQDYCRKLLPEEKKRQEEIALRPLPDDAILASLWRKEWDPAAEYIERRLAEVNLVLDRSLPM